jgi:hypothetical protein
MSWKKATLITGFFVAWFVLIRWVLPMCGVGT